MIVRELPQECRIYRESNECQESLQLLVNEPGQKTLAYDLNGRTDNDPLTPMEIEILEKHTKPVRDNLPTLYELGDEITSAYGTLTYRSMIIWEVNNGWLVSNITFFGIETLKNIHKK